MDISRHRRHSKYVLTNFLEYILYKRYLILTKHLKEKRECNTSSKRGYSFMNLELHYHYNQLAHNISIFLAKDIFLPKIFKIHELFISETF